MNHLIAETGLPTRVHLPAPSRPHDSSWLTACGLPVLGKIVSADAGRYSFCPECTAAMVGYTDTTAERFTTFDRCPESGH